MASTGRGRFSSANGGEVSHFYGFWGLRSDRTLKAQTAVDHSASRTVATLGRAPRPPHPLGFPEAPNDPKILVVLSGPKVGIIYMLGALGFGVSNLKVSTDESVQRRHLSAIRPMMCSACVTSFQSPCATQCLASSATSHRSG